MSGPGQTLLCVLCISLLAFAQPETVWAQEDAEPATIFENPVDLDIDETDQRSPLTAALGFMRNAESGNYEAASEYLDLRYLPEELANVDSQVLAEQLYTVITRTVRIDFGALSDDPDGRERDGLPSFRDSLGEIDSSRGKIPVYLQRVPGADQSRIWKISNATVGQIPELYSEFGYHPFVESVRDWSPDFTIFGIELFKWIIASLAGAVGALAWLILSSPLSRILTRRNVQNRARVKRYLTRPVPAAIYVVLAFEGLRSLGLGVTATRLVEGGTLVTIVSVWLLFATINLFRDLYGQHLEALGRASALMLLPPVTTTVKTIIALLAFTVWLDNIGVNVTALVAGLGLGSLAVALALQKPLEDILGAITLYTQQPVTVGQYCTSGSVTGTIEKISLRSTRVRKIDNSLVIIPNSVFATASIENVSARQRILHRQVVRLALDTTEAEIRAVLDVLRDVLQSHANVTTNGWRVRFVELGEFSKNVEVFAHIETTDWLEFLEISEDINLRTIAALESTGVKLAVPPR